MSLEWIEELKELFFTADVKKLDVKGAQTLKQKHFPSSLYKYRTVSEHSLRNLRERSLFCAFASRFNDPYDSAMKFDPGFGKSYVQLFMENGPLLTEREQEVISTSENPLLALLRAEADRIDQVVSDDELRKVAEALSATHEKFQAEMVINMNSLLQNSYKICSLCERLDSLPMWVHYAEGHTGFAMEYDFKSLPSDDFISLCLWPVIYSGIFDASYVLKGVEPGKPFNNLFGVMAALYKAEDWSYEKEWRIVIPDSPTTPETSYRAPLKAVYLGANMKEEDELKVVKEAKMLGVPIYKMQLVPHQFRMEPVPV